MRSWLCPAPSKCRAPSPLPRKLPTRFDGYVAIGVVIRGETSHYDIVAGESARGIMELTLDGLCIGNGIVTVENEAQAWNRARRSGAGQGRPCGPCLPDDDWPGAPLAGGDGRSAIRKSPCS